MTPPKAPVDGTIASQGVKPSAVLSRLETLQKRPDFQRVTRSQSTATAGFILQMRKRKPEEVHVDEQSIRVGFTCSKKVGNAVARNRAKRRLREIARLSLPSLGLPGHDYVLVGRKNITADLAFPQLQSDLTRALSILHGTRK